MTLKYVGPKPIISCTGIELDKNKEDKFVYLSIVVELTKALDHSYIEDKSYIYEEGREPTLSEIIQTLEKYCPNFNEMLEKTNHNVQEEIDHNLQRAHESKTLKSIEKEVLLNNINMMHDYMIQRSINKRVYYCAMSALADIVKKDHISYIKVPFTEKFMHVLHSLQGTLGKENHPIDTKLEIFKKDDNLFIKLKVVTLSN
ncbi:hypothetical protein [Sulfurimonas sp.]|uniref:hypothetical protein n=1 Tax=Sulfurimonas sp. TaxID=2022749 RepID=UPI002AB0D8D1|nr:hypothetical protein [Sulfurimonas sp.]